MEMWQVGLLLLSLASLAETENDENVWKVEVIETVCHKLAIYSTTATSTNGSCQCKNECGGSMIFPYNLTPQNLNDTRWIASLIATGQLDNRSSWITTVMNDAYLYKYKCKCGLYGDWSTIEYNAFQSITALFVVQIVRIFFPSDPILFIVERDYSSWLYAKARFQAIAELMLPFLILISVFNVTMALKLWSKEATAFTFQTAQYIMSFFALIFNSLLFRNLVGVVMLNSFDNYFFIAFTETFLFCSQLMASFLMADRCMSVMKPFLYKNHASPKKALIICVLAFLFSLLLSSGNFISKYTPKLNSEIFMTGTFTSSALYFILVIFELIAVTIFLIFTKRLSSDTSQQLKQNQRNINFIFISSSLIESTSGVCYMAYNIVVGLLVWANYKKDIGLFTYETSKEGGIGLARTCFICLGPFISLIFCIYFSKTYRRALFSLFKCSALKRNKLNSVGASSEHRTSVSRISYWSTKDQMTPVNEPIGH